VLNSFCFSHAREGRLFARQLFFSIHFAGSQPSLSSDGIYGGLSCSPPRCFHLGSPLPVFGQQAYFLHPRIFMHCPCPSKAGVRFPHQRGRTCFGSCIQNSIVVVFHSFLFFPRRCRKFSLRVGLDLFPPPDDGQSSRLLAIFGLLRLLAQPLCPPLRGSSSSNVSRPGPYAYRARLFPADWFFSYASPLHLALLEFFV